MYSEQQQRTRNVFGPVEDSLMPFSQDKKMLKLLKFQDLLIHSGGVISNHNVNKRHCEC